METLTTSSLTGLDGNARRGGDQVHTDRTILVIGGTGTTGRRVAARLWDRGATVRIGSRRGTPPFEWADPGTWDAVLAGAGAVYIAYSPDLAAPGAADAVAALTRRAVALGARRLVLLSGRGEEEARAAEAAFAAAAGTAGWTVLRASWFSQGFSEKFMADGTRAGELALPVGDVPEPFVDAEDIADVAVAALTEDGHAGRTYELTGPRAITFDEAVRTIAAAAGRDIRLVRISHEEMRAGLEAVGVPPDETALLGYLFGEVLDGRNARPADGVRRALGRPPREFAAFARAAAAAGAWRPSAAAA
jgi:uncharacterized protein YbjT (DUF2867 family)